MLRRCRRGELSQDETQKLPSANVLTRAVGIHPHLTLQQCVEEVTAGDRYLISTDGLHKELTLETVQHMMNGPFDDQILQALIDEALDLGGRDNVTGVIVDVGEQFDEAEAYSRGRDGLFVRGPPHRDLSPCR